MQIHKKEIENIGTVSMEVLTSMDVTSRVNAGDTAFVENLVALANSQLVHHQYSSAAKKRDKDGVPYQGKVDVTQVWVDSDGVWHFNWKRTPGKRDGFTQADRLTAKALLALAVQHGFPMTEEAALESARKQRLAAGGVEEPADADESEVAE